MNRPPAHRIPRRLALPLLVALALSFTHCVAMAFPQGPLTLVVPFAAGGPTDTVARALARQMGSALGRPIRVENIAGLGGTRAPAELARQPGDGHLLMLHHIGMATAPTLYRSLPYQPLRDFEPIGLVVDAPMVLLTQPGLHVAGGRQFGASLRARAATLSVAYAGLGAASHLCGMLLGSVLQIDLISVPYKGTGPALRDLQKGAADLMCDQTTAAIGAIRDGSVRAHAVTTPRRLEVLPEIPTTAEIGLGGLQLSIWHGLYAQRGASPQAIHRLSVALREAVTSPAFVAAMSTLGVQPVRADQATPDAHRTLLAAQIARWRPVIHKAGQYAD